MAQAPTIFISYRRDDSAGHVGRLYDALSQRYGVSNIFVDIDRIGPGEDFVRALDDAVSKATAVIVVIGRNWAGETATGARLQQPNDFVRMEVAAGLKRSAPLIPVLVQGATMPSAAQLPSDLHELTKRNAFEISDLRWREDVARLVKHLDGFVFPTTDPVPLPPRVKWAIGAVAAAAVAIAVATAIKPLMLAHSAYTANDKVPSGEVTPPPGDLVKESADILEKAQEWRKDASLVSLEVRTAPAQNGQGLVYSVVYSFVSPVDMEGLWVFTHGGDASPRYSPTNRPVTWSTGEIPSVFIELPQAIDAAHRAGMRGNIDRATLEVYTMGRRHAPVWTLFQQSSSPYYVDAATAQVIQSRRY